MKPVKISWPISNLKVFISSESNIEMLVFREIMWWAAQLNQISHPNIGILLDKQATHLKHFWTRVYIPIHDLSIISLENGCPCRVTITIYQSKEEAFAFVNQARTFETTTGNWIWCSCDRRWCYRWVVIWQYGLLKVSKRWVQN